MFFRGYTALFKFMRFVGANGIRPIRLLGRIPAPTNLKIKLYLITSESAVTIKNGKIRQISGL
jgi:hypothetical protein